MIDMRFSYEIAVPILLLVLEVLSNSSHIGQCKDKAAARI